MVNEIEMDPETAPEITTSPDEVVPEDFEEGLADIPVSSVEDVVKTDAAEIKENTLGDSLDMLHELTSNESYIDSISVGYIPPVMREGNPNHNSQITLTSEQITEIREKIPDFGKMAGGTIDTSQYNKLWSVNMEQVRPYISPENTISVKYANVYVDYGKEFQIDAGSGRNHLNVNYHPANLYSFEFIGENHERYYNVYIGNDLGHLYQQIPVMENSILLNIEGVKVDFLDRTNIEAPQHYSKIEAIEFGSDGKPLRDENGKVIPLTVDNKRIAISDERLETLRNTLESKNAECLNSISDMITDKLDVVRSEIQTQEKEKETISGYYNDAKLVRDYIGGEIVSATEKVDQITSEIVTVMTDMDSLDKLSDEYQKKEEYLFELKSEYSEATLKLSEVIKGVLIGEEVQDGRNAESILELASNIYDQALEKLEIYQEFEEKLGKLKESYEEGKLSEDERFSTLFEIDSTHRIIPAPANFSYSIDSNLLVFKEKLVEDWNQKLENMDMQLSVDKNTGEIWSEYGFKIEFNKDGSYDIVDSFRIDKAKNDIVGNIIRNLSEGSVEKESVHNLANLELVNGIKVGEIGEYFYSSTVSKDHKPDQIDRLCRNKCAFAINKISELEDVLKERGFDKHSLADIFNDVVTLNTDLKEELKEEIKAVPLDTDSRAHVDSNMDKEGKIFSEDRIRRVMSGGYGKIDVKMPVELSQKRSDEIYEKALKKAEGNQERAEIIFNKEKYAELYKLSGLKQKLVDLEEKLGKYDEVPHTLKFHNMVYQFYKTEFDETVYQYKKMGGKVGNDCFCIKSASGLECFADLLSFLRTNIVETVFIGLAMRLSEWSEIEIGIKKHDNPDSDKADTKDEEKQELEKIDIEHSEEKPDNIEEPEEKPDSVEEPEEKADNVEEAEEKTDNVEETEEKPDDVEEPEEKPDNVEEVEEKSDDVEEKLDTVEGSEEKTDTVERPEEKTDTVEELEEKTDNVKEKFDGFEERESDLSKFEETEKPLNDIYSEVEESKTENREPEESKIDNLEHESSDTENIDTKIDATVVEEDFQDSDKPEQENDFTVEDETEIDNKSSMQELKEKVKDNLDEKEDMESVRDILSDVLIDDFSSDDLVDTLTTTLSDYINTVDTIATDYSTVSEIIDIFADAISDASGNAPDDVREEIYQGLSDKGVAAKTISEITDYVADITDNKELNVVDAYGEFGGIAYDDTEVIDLNDIPHIDYLDIQNDIEQESIENMDAASAGIDESNLFSGIEKQIVDELIQRGYEPDVAINYAETVIESADINELMFNPDFVKEAILEYCVDNADLQDVENIDVTEINNDTVQEVDTDLSQDILPDSAYETDNGNSVYDHMDYYDTEDVSGYIEI